jgi:hypothetical protein
MSTVLLLAFATGAIALLLLTAITAHRVRVRRPGAQRSPDDRSATRAD